MGFDVDGDWNEMTVKFGVYLDGADFGEVFEELGKNLEVDVWGWSVDSGIDHTDGYAWVTLKSEDLI